MAIWDDIGDVLGRLRGDPPPLKPTFTPAPAATPDPYAAAVVEAKRRYPRLKNLPISLTYNPQRDFSSETYPPDEEGNPAPGNWTVDIGRQVHGKPDTWPEQIGLEGLHGLQGTDPTYQKFIDQLIKSYTPDQMKRARANFERDKGDVPPDFNRYLRWVDAQEVVRGHLWGDFFRMNEHPKGEKPNKYAGYTPQQIQLLENIGSYLRSSD